MEHKINEIRKMMSLVEQLERIEKSLNSALSIYERTKLEEQQKLITLDIKEIALKAKLNSGEINNDLIRDFALLETERQMLRKNELIRENKTYNLSSENIVSKKNGEIINIKHMNVSDKIKIIYEYTGTIISYQDPVITKKRDDSYKSLSMSITRKIGKQKLMKKYGDNWEIEIEKIYKDSYDKFMNSYINRIAKEVAEKKEQQKAYDIQNLQKKKERFEELRKDVVLLNNQQKEEEQKSVKK